MSVAEGRLEGVLFPGLHAPVLVAEIGINHEGDLGFAQELVHAAAEAGADAVKFQVFHSERFYHAGLAPRGFELFRGFELGLDDFLVLRQLSEHKGLSFFVTPLDDVSLRWALEQGIAPIKFASSDIATEPMLRMVAEAGVPALVSTGMATEPDMERVRRIFGKAPFMLMYAVSEYPTPPEHVDLQYFARFASEEPNGVGFSDHSLGIGLALAAVTLGARVVEKHFTTDTKRVGADHAVSLDPVGLMDLKAGMQAISAAQGTGQKRMHEAEATSLPLSRRAMFCARDIARGERIQAADILLLRPGNGVRLEEYDALLGKPAKQDYRKGEHFSQ